MKRELQKIRKCWSNSQVKICKLSNEEQEYLTSLYDDIEIEATKYFKQEESLLNGQLTASEITTANHALQINKSECVALMQILSKELNCNSGSNNQPTFTDRGARPGAVSIRPNKMESTAAKKLSNTGKRQEVKKY